MSSSRDVRQPLSREGRPSSPRQVESALRERAELSLEEHAAIAAAVAVKSDRPRAEVLEPFGFSEAEWDSLFARLTERIVAEIRERAGSGLPIEERYPLSASYAKAYALAVRDARSESTRSEDEATIRIPPGTSSDEPFSVLGASNRAARS